MKIFLVQSACFNIGKSEWLENRELSSILFYIFVSYEFAEAKLLQLMNEVIPESISVKLIEDDRYEIILAETRFVFSLDEITPNGLLIDYTDEGRNKTVDKVLFV